VVRPSTPLGIMAGSFDAPRQRPPTYIGTASSANTPVLSPLTPLAAPLLVKLPDLATICLNTIAPSDRSCRLPARHTPTPLQRRALDLLGVSRRLGVA
jgi:hypothetical protein